MIESDHQNFLPIDLIRLIGLIELIGFIVLIGFIELIGFMELIESIGKKIGIRSSI